MINVTPTAASKITELLTEENKPEAGLRVFVQGGGCSGFQCGLMIDEGEGDAVGRRHPVERREAADRSDQRPLLAGAEVDFVDNITGGGFTIKKNASPPAAADLHSAFNDTPFGFQPSGRRRCAGPGG